MDSNENIKTRFSYYWTFDRRTDISVYSFGDCLIIYQINDIYVYRSYK